MFSLFGSCILAGVIERARVFNLAFGEELSGGYDYGYDEVWIEAKDHVWFCFLKWSYITCHVRFG